jgi:hypothetical protein
MTMVRGNQGDFVLFLFISFYYVLGTSAQSVPERRGLKGCSKPVTRAIAHQFTASFLAEHVDLSANGDADFPAFRAT